MNDKNEYIEEKRGCQSEPQPNDCQTCMLYLTCQFRARSDNSVSHKNIKFSLRSQIQAKTYRESAVSTLYSVPCICLWTHQPRSGGITPCGDSLNVDIAALVLVEDDAQRTLELHYPIVDAGRAGRSSPSEKVVVICHGQGGAGRRSSRTDAVTACGGRSKGRGGCGDQGQEDGNKDGSHFLFVILCVY